MAGNPNFPFIFGFLSPNRIVLEYVCEDDGSTSPTLADILHKTALMHWKLVKIAIDLCKAIHCLHTKGLLHNDLHTRNILIRNTSNVKVIDFGKSTLIIDPLKYKIEPGSSRHKRFNSIHTFLAYELRNIPGSYQTIASDVYSLGYNIDQIARAVKNEGMTLLALNMMSKTPEKRPQISRCITVLERLL